MRCLNISANRMQKADYLDRKIDFRSESSPEVKTDSVERINNQLQRGEEGRLFAVVHLCGKQFKITAGDIILVEGYWPPTIGDRIRLDKVLLAGAKDFTLIGTPMLESGLVDIQATIIEKTLSHTKTHFKKKRRKQYMRINFQRSPFSMIRINSINIQRNIADEDTQTPPQLQWDNQIC